VLRDAIEANSLKISELDGMIEHAEQLLGIRPRGPMN
jgi:hypothetical protein